MPVYASLVTLCSQRPEKGVGFLGTGVTDSCESLCERWVKPRPSARAVSALNH